MHSVMNSLFAKRALAEEFPDNESLDIYEALGSDNNKSLNKKVRDLAQSNGMIFLEDESGANIDVQIFDAAKFGSKSCCYQLPQDVAEEDKPVIFVMDYAFGEQAYETIDELLKPMEDGKEKVFLNVDSVSIMGKAGILEGGKGDLMIPSAHIFEGTADNYPFNNELKGSDFEGHGLKVMEGTMVTVLGTSLQNLSLIHI